MSICITDCLYVFPFNWLLSVCLSVCLFVCLPACLSACLSVWRCLSIWLSDCLYVYLSDCQFVPKYYLKKYRIYSCYYLAHRPADKKTVPGTEHVWPGVWRPAASVSRPRGVSAWTTRWPGEPVPTRPRHRHVHARCDACIKWKLYFSI